MNLEQGEGAGLSRNLHFLAIDGVFHQSSLTVWVEMVAKKFADYGLHRTTDQIGEGAVDRACSPPCRTC